MKRMEKIFAAFDAGESPGALYDALYRVPIRSQHDLRDLLDGLRCTEWRGHLAVAKTLKKATAFPSLAIPVLIDLLNHTEELVACEAAATLGAFGARADAAVPALLAKLAQNPGYSGQNFVAALGAIGTRPDHVIPALIPLVATETLGEAACEALARFPDRLPDLFPVLRDALRSETYGIRGAAARALAATPPPRGRIIDALVQRAVESSEDAYALVPVLAALGQETDRIVLTLAPIVEADTLRPFMKNFRAWPVLATMLQDPDPAIRVRAAMLLAMAHRGTEVPRLVEALHDPEIRSIVIDTLGRIGGAEGAAALQALTCDDDATRDQVRAALRRLGRRPASPRDGIDIGSLRRVAIPRVADGRAIRVGDRVWFAWHEIKKKSRGEAWRTDADEFGIAAIRLHEGAVERWPLPIGFPVQPTGGAGAKRRFRLALEADGAFLCVLQDPFSDRRGWGNDNYLYSFRDGAWWRLVPPGDRVPLVAAPREDPAFTACFGEAIVWKDEDGSLRLEQDATPYHLDDWEFTDAVRAAMDAQTAWEEREPRLEISMISNDLWIVDSVAHKSRPAAAPGQKRFYGPGSSMSPLLGADGAVLVRTSKGDAALLM